MDLNQWRTAVKQQAGRLRQRLTELARGAEQLAPGMIYGATASLAVLPLVAAAQGGTVPFVELAALLGSVGANLLSTELYDWRKRSDKELDEVLPAHLGELAAANPDWRAVLNKLIEETQAVTATQDQLGPVAGAYWDALDQDLQRLGSRLIIANVSGSQNVIIGDNNTQNYTTNNYYGPPTPITFDDVLHSYLARERRLCDELPLAKSKADAQRIPRMQNVFVELRTTLPVDEATWFDRLGTAPGQRKRLRDQVERQASDEMTTQRRSSGAVQADQQAWFAELHRLDEKKLVDVAKTLGVTPDQVHAARHPLTPLEHLHSLRNQQQPLHQVLLGDPGGGKSTWVRRLTSVLAWQRLTADGETLDPLGHEEAAWLLAAQQAFGGSRGGGPLPIRIAMHRWASLVRKGELKLTGAASDLVAVCAHAFKEAHAAESIKLLDHTFQMLQHGKAVILLDGLDEVSDDAQRARMIAAVRAFIKEATYQNTPLLITCRSKPYARLQARGQAVLNDAHVCTLGPLDDDAIQLFIDRWYAEMIWAERGEPTKLQADARRLRDALPVRPDLRRMAGTPLLLTMMARTNQESGLPDGRAELYENLVQELLWEWEVRRTYGESGVEALTQPDALGAETLANQRSLLEILHATNPGLTAPDVEKVLNQLAYEVHGGATGEAVEIERRILEEHFARLVPSPPDDGKGKARAAELATNVVNFIGQRTGLLVDIEDGQRFRFTHYTFQEYLAARWIAAGDYTSRLHKMKGRVDDVHWREAIFLALGCLVSEVHKAYDDAVLLVESFLRQAPASEQDRQRLLLLGEAFVRQCTPDKLRRAVDEERTRYVVHLVAERLCAAMQERTLPAATRLEVGLLLDDLRSQHGLAPPGLDEFIAVPNTDLYVGKYPVTNHQFKRFVDAGGYGAAGDQRPPWWSEQGWEYRRRYNWTTPRWWDDRKFNRGTQPVVGVSWHEAEANCNWLNDPASASHLPGSADCLRTGARAHLPTQEHLNAVFWVMFSDRAQSAR